MTSVQRRIVFSLLATWVAWVLVLTLSPAGVTPALTLEGFLCVGCGTNGTADIILNWALFLPGGAMMAIVLDGRRAVITALCFTVFIETIQIGVPGRDPALQDLLFNTVGASCGVLLLRRGLGRRGQRALAALMVVAWLFPVVGLIPLTSGPELHVLWTPALGGLEKYRGHILAAAVGGLSVPSRIVASKATLDTAIVERRRMELLLEVGPRPSNLAALFHVVSSSAVAVATVDILGEDLMLRGENPSRVLGLEQPSARWPGAMQEVKTGDTVRIVVDRGTDSVCMSVGPRTQCQLAPSLGEGWGHLLNAEAEPAWVRMLLTLVWSVGIGAVLGATSGTARAALITGVGLAATGLVASKVSPDVRPEVMHAALLATGIAFGTALRSSIHRLWRAVRSIERLAASTSPRP